MTDTSAISSPTRMIDGVELPGSGTWLIDPGHAQVGFLGRHLKFTKVRGRFADVDGTIVVGEDPNDTAVDVTIAMTSVDTGNRDRDEHLRSPDLFDVVRFPTATFRGKAQNWRGSTGELAGALTIKGVTKPVVFEVEYLGFVTDPWGGNRIVFTGSTTINREDFGVTWNMVLEAGGLLVSKEITLELELEATRQ
jgi:polyisoprenoid-binding protein YceI